MQHPARRIAEHVERWRARSVPEMHDRLVRCWLRKQIGEWKIRTEQQAVVPLKPNYAQCLLTATMLDMALEELPIRVNVLKARKGGISTDVQVTACDLAAHCEHQSATTIAHEATATEEIFKIAGLACEHFRYADGNLAAKVNTRDIEFFATKSQYNCQTAGGVGVKAGGTPSFIHFSERPKWEQNKTETHYNAVSALPTIPTTVLVDESTAKGREEFFSNWEAGLGLGHPSRSIFIPWYTDDRLRWTVPQSFEPDDYELELIRRAHGFGVEVGYDQLVWRRRKIKEYGEGHDERGEAIFRQEYPSTPEEAVQSAEGLILPNPRKCLVDSTPFKYSALSRDCLVGGIDFGYSHTDATVIWSAVYYRGILFFVRLWRAFDTLAEDQVHGLMDGHLYFYDPAGLGAAKELHKAAYRVGKRIRIAPAPRTRNPGEDPGTVELHLLASWMARGQLKVSSDPAVSRQFVVECDSFCWNPKTGKPNAVRGSEVGHYDTVMAAKYCVMGCERSPVRLETTVPANHATRRTKWASV